MKIHNFSSGPAILPEEVLLEASKAVVDFNGSGLSILTMSHRSKLFEAVIEEARSLVREILGLSAAHQVLFLSGGASSQFYMIPMNFLGADQKVSFTDTGVWANKAIKEAKRFGQVDVLASSKESTYSFIPKAIEVPKDSQYLHLTSNNTIYGTQYQQFPETEVPIVCDMSSDIFSRPLPIDKFGVIYAGAQKNMGPAGTTLVVLSPEFASRQPVRDLPTMLNYQTHIAEGSMFNTPPTFPIYVSMLTMRWIKAQGGLEAMQVKNEHKAAVLYNEIDRNPLFKGTVAAEDRSRMNVCFVPVNPDHEKPFFDLCTQHGMVDFKGHRSVGGFRASIYNAMPLASIELMVQLMQEFEKNNA